MTLNIVARGGLSLQGVVSSATEFMKYMSCHPTFLINLLSRKRKKTVTSGSNADFSEELCESLNIHALFSLHVQ